MSRRDAILRSTNYFDDGVFLDDITELVKIPTESQNTKGIKHCEKYLHERMIPIFTQMGFDTKLYKNPVDGFGPALLATRLEDACMPTILGYGHGDVVLGMESQ